MRPPMEEPARFYLYPGTIVAKDNPEGIHSVRYLFIYTLSLLGVYSFCRGRVVDECVF